GLRVECSLDQDSYEKGIKISKEEMSRLNLKLDEFHGEWNYTISSVLTDSIMVLRREERR
ncbi:rhodopirellula transposase, partial [mine drainage metagenome]